MYTIYADGQAFYAPNLVSEGYGVIAPKLTVELNKAGSLEFTLPPNNVMYDSIQKLKAIITVLQDEEELFRGRVLHDERDFYNRKAVYCEGELAFLMDSIQRTYDYSGTLSGLFTQYINNHNSQVETAKQFKVGQITVTDKNDYVHYSSSQYPKTLDEINEKLINTHGGYVRTRLSSNNRYADYIADYDSVNSQVIEFGVNMLDITEYISAENVFTVLIPLGAEITNEDGSSAGRLTIESVNNGKDYIEDEAAIALFGRIWKVQEWDDVTVAANLLTKGNAFLNAGIEMAVSLTIKAVDLHLLDVDTERIRLGDYVRVISLPHKLDKYFLCSKIVYDLVNPDKTEYTFGVTFGTMTEKQLQSEKTTKSNIQIVQSATQSAQNSVNQANNAVQQVEQVISQMPTDYVKTSVFEAYQKEVNSKISAVYHVKGSVANYAALPSFDREIGDVWNLLDTGANYVWTDSGWDKLSETIDLSGYALKKDIPTVPSNISDFENDAGYLTGEQAETDYVKTSVFEELVKRVEVLERSGE